MEKDSKQMTYVLEDGGELILWSGVDIVQVGDHGMPERLTYRHKGSARQPSAVLEIEVWDGQPVCVSAELVGKKEQRIPVRARDLKTLSSLIETVIDAAAIRLGFSETGSGWGMGFPGSVDDQRARLKSVRASRRKIDNPAFLEQVAEIYKVAPTPKLDYLAAELDCSPRSAARYKKAAEEKGFI